MIDKLEIASTVEAQLKGTDLFLVSVKVSKNNEVEIEIDGDRDITLDDCVAVNDAVLAAHDRDKEDYELTVGSCGLTAPYVVKRQYLKNIGNDVEVLTGDGIKLKGTLKEVGDDTFTIAVTRKVKLEGKKRPEMVEEPVELRFDEIKYTKTIIDF